MFRISRQSEDVPPLAEIPQYARHLHATFSIAGACKAPPVLPDLQGTRARDLTLLELLISN
jgi:hypothetical protein